MNSTMPSLTSDSDRDDRRWASVNARDVGADGRFVYAVSSTGIYCRPSCPSRRPRRERVAFFENGAEAARAGYRPCRRCRPDVPDHADPWVDKVRRACVYLANVDGHLSLARLAERLGGSPYHLQRNFKRIVGVSPREYAEACRFRTVRRRLGSAGDVTSAMVDAGYGSSSRFYERAVPMLGMSPTTYQRGGAGTSIQYTITECPLGQLLVAATPRGVCAISLGEEARELEAALKREYPAASIGERADRSTMLSRWAKAVVAHLAGDAPNLQLPLDIRATAFQWRVWRTLAAIPYGTTVSYAEVAHRLGRPRAVRAVARACATNPVALAIPCHRVVQSGGGLGGYRWGVERKARLLDRERAAAKAGNDEPR